MTAETVTPAETRTVTTMRADQLQPGDVVKLVGLCSVLGVEPISDGRCLVHVRLDKGHLETAIWLWKYSRVEVLSDVSGRGHLVTPMQSDVMPEATEEAK